jgi:hypothetical protein
MPFIIGGLMAASAVAGGIGQASQNKAQAAAAKMQMAQENFQNRWQNEAANRNLLRQWEAQYHVNKQIELAANRERASNSYYLREEYKNASSAMSRNTRQVTDSFLAAASSAGVSLDSASARAMLRQASTQAREASANLRMNVQNRKRDIQANYENRLAQRNLSSAEQRAFIESRATTVDSSSNIMATAVMQGVLGGASAGVGAYNQTGWEGSLSGQLWK